LNNISFEVNKGDIFGIIGPDGAGKTTLFRILTTLLLADSGSATVNGLDVIKEFRKIRNSIGYMPGRFSLYQDLSVEENLSFYASIFNTTIEENYAMIKEIYQQLEPFKTRRAGALSGGMKQKLALCCALIHKPVVLFLDEPTTGVDPVSRKEFWEMLKRIKKEGITIMVSTSYMDEASLCDRIALIQNSSFLKVDTPQKIVSQYCETLWAASSENMSKLLTALKDFPVVKKCYPFGDVHHITIDLQQNNLISSSSLPFTPELLKEELEKLGHCGVIVNKIEPTIEDCFMELSKN
jgi:ABC-type multidrug transport system ATPase subunit